MPQSEKPIKRRYNYDDVELFGKCSLDVVRGRWNSHEREVVIRETAEQDGEHVLVGLEMERGSGGLDSRNFTIRNLAGFAVKSTPITGTKEQRAEPFSTQVNAGNVFCAIAAWNKDYLDELQYFPFGTYDDQVDASSGAFKLVAFYKPAQIECNGNPADCAVVCPRVGSCCDSCDLIPPNVRNVTRATVGGAADLTRFVLNLKGPFCLAPRSS
jgi:predicted phage terminase large subunit-like protein